MRNLWTMAALISAFALAGCGGDDDDDDVAADGDADSDADSDADTDADSDADSDADADGDTDADCDAACDHLETCQFPDFNHVTCVAQCQCNIQGVVRPELADDVVACSTTTECVADWSAQCVESLDFEPGEAAATFVENCNAAVQATCPDEAADYDCRPFAAITEEAAEAFDACLAEATCADALQCILDAALGICTG